MLIDWDKPDERYYMTGLDRGVLYPKGAVAVPFNGLRGFDEGESSTSTVLYRDGIIYLADMDASDFSGKLTTIFFPPEFSRCVGIPEATDGLYVDNQKPKMFDFSYRVLVGSGTEGDMFRYQIHLVYNAMASIAPRSRRTLAESTEMTEFNFDLVCAPVRLPGYRPSAHYVIDTMNMSAGVIAQIETILYGVATPNHAPELPARMPTPTELYELMNFGDAVIFTVSADGRTFKVEGAHKNVQLDAYNKNRIRIQNVNAVTDQFGQVVVADDATTVVNFS